MFFVSGSLITIEEGLTPAWDQVFQIDRRSGIPSRTTAIVFRPANGFHQLRF